MKKAIMALGLLAILAGCSSAPKPPPPPAEQELIIDKHIQPMMRNEVISAIGECESNKMRAVLIYGKRKINGYSAEVVVDVTCAPKASW